jgi:hypothetical protein
MLAPPRLATVLALAPALACTRPPPRAAAPPRAYRLGFSATPPRPEIAAALRAVDMWTKRADAALLALTVPWRSLLADTSAGVLVRRDQLQLVQLYRSRGLMVAAMVDATDGLARDKEAPELVALGRSIREPAVQAAYREYVLAVDSILHPDYLALAMETNLVRLAAPRDVYESLRTMVNAAAQALRAQGTAARLAVTVQVDAAWGRLQGTNQFVGVDQDRADFPFIEALGLSAYPFLAAFAEPEQVPLDYYRRLAPDGALPLLVMEGGWTSASVGSVVSTPERQARWITRQMQLADEARARAIFQITFTDLDLTSFPVPPGSILPLFAHLGMVDASFRPKPALAEWDRAFARPLRP